uniref:Uncharacterized protein n=1 Tax=Romanomermis culicivorax TaxID=13658 RepID=A0A915KJG1_ROMCU
MSLQKLVFCEQVVYFLKDTNSTIILFKNVNPYRIYYLIQIFEISFIIQIGHISPIFFGSLNFGQFLFESEHFIDVSIDLIIAYGDVRV